FCRDHLPPADQWPDLLVAEAGLDYPERLNCAVELLDRVIDQRGAARPCLLAPRSDPWSYGDVQRRVSQVAHVLRARFGLVPGHVLPIADTFARHVVRIEPDDVVTGTPPLAFTFGLGGLVVFPMRVGAAMLLLEKVPPLGLADAIAEHSATVCFTAPTAYKA